MAVTADVKGEETRTIDVPPDATPKRVLAELDLSVHEATVLVDGRPVPDDASIEATTLTVLRLVKGG